MTIRKLLVCWVRQDGNVVAVYYGHPGMVTYEAIDMLILSKILS